MKDENESIFHIDYSRICFHVWFRVVCIESPDKWKLKITDSNKCVVSYVYMYKIIFDGNFVDMEEINMSLNDDAILTNPGFMGQSQADSPTCAYM